ncbi:hypothetical protein KY342_01185, partial [Candidatus Woesearchaeota archaeon]|nr:hypothetical protein [Candidatus Woesearchaeota archaeon]
MIIEQIEKDNKITLEKLNQKIEDLGTIILIQSKEIRGLKMLLSTHIVAHNARHDDAIKFLTQIRMYLRYLWKKKDEKIY